MFEPAETIILLCLCTPAENQPSSTIIARKEGKIVSFVLDICTYISWKKQAWIEAKHKNENSMK
jgi:hypothetical protein